MQTCALSRVKQSCILILFGMLFGGFGVHLYHTTDWSSLLAGLQ